MKKDKIYSERTVHAALKKAVERLGGVIFKNHPQTNRGIPDVIIHIPNGIKAIYVETKTTGQECTPIQIQFHCMLKRMANIETYVLDTRIDNFYDLFDVGYTEYEGKHYDRNPFKDKHKGYTNINNEEIRESRR